MYLIRTQIKLDYIIDNTRYYVIKSIKYMFKGVKLWIGKRMKTA